jgi:cytoskeleton protein RodZ
MLIVGALIASLVVWLIYANLKPAQDSPSTEISLVEPASESAPSAPTLPEAALPAAERKAEAEPVELSKPATAKAAEPVSGSANIKFTFTDSSWVSVQDKDGKTVLSKLAQKGSSEEAFGVPPLKVLIGNAAAATVLFEGKPVDLSGHSNNNVASMTLSAE